MGRAREVIKWFREHHKGMELIEAVRKQDVEKVKVRRPLEAVSSTEHGPSRGVSGARSVDPRCRRRTPDSALLCRIYPPAVRRPSGNFDSACRHSSVPVRTPSSVTRTLPCHIAESPHFSPPLSRAIAISATLRSLARLMGARAGSEMASAPSPPGVLFPLTVTQKQNAVDPRGPFFRVPAGTWGTPVGPTPAPRHRRAQL
jgi:hypothetical protein